MQRPGRVERPGYGELALVFARLSALGFGGPNAHLALMLHEVVERRGWVTHEHFLQLLAVTNLLPGPNSSEVAIHVGYTQRGWRGGLVTGLAFLAPAFVLVVILSWVYFRYGTLPAAAALFRGLQPMIVAVILGAGWKLARTAVTDGNLGVLAIGGMAVAVLLDGWEVIAMAAGGLLGWALYRGRGQEGAGREPEPDGGTRAAFVLAPAAALIAGLGELGRIFWLTLWSGSVLFGGGYMLIALLEPHVVHTYGWLSPQQFLDGIALTQTVPGPIVTLVAFVGYGVAGIPGALVATAGIYIPSFAAVFLVAPRLEQWRSIGGVQAALKGVSAVVAGAILGVALTLIPPAVPDVWAGLLLAAGLVAVFRFDVGAVWLVVAGLGAGLIRSVLGW